MVRTRNEIEELIASFLNGEATPEQAMWLEEWKAENDENLALFVLMEKTWSLSNGRERFKSPSVENAWKKVEVHIKERAKTIPLWKNPRFIIGVAAAGVIAFLLGVFFANSVQPEQFYADEDPDKSEKVIPAENVLLASDKVSSFTLEDNSIVNLEEGSQLTLAADYNVNGRKVELKGSGTFEVVHDESNPFVVMVEGLEVYDIGTVFTIDTRGDTVSIVVAEGAVELRLNGKTLDMVEGDSAFYLISDRVMERYESKEVRQDKVFVFDGTNLEEVASILGKFFKRKIVVMDESIAECPVSVTFKNEDLPTILDIIRELLDVKIVRNKDIIGIYGEGCN